jgi:hypothetical protein
MDGMHLCMHVESISPPFDGGASVEVKFVLPCCHGVLGGELRVRVDAEDAHKYMRGDTYMIRMRRI